VQYDNSIGIKIFPAQYRTTTNSLHATDACAARQLQLAVKLHIFEEKTQIFAAKTAWNARKSPHIA
jgi:hypothetical protein